MRRLAFILIAALATLALAVPASAETWYGQVFRSPSGNLICKYRASNDSIACGRRNDQRILAMTSYGAAREGYRMDWRGLQVHTLYYGEKYRGVGSHITCGSFYNGVRCTNWSGHGFFINRDTLNAW
jgi:hypothetical protein